MLSKVDKYMTYAFPVILILIGSFYYFANPNSGHFTLQCPWRVCTGT